MIELAEYPARILEVIIEWAKVHQDIRGVALVGSHARGTARLDSDIDLMVLAVNTEAFRSDGSWIEAIDWSGARVKVANWRDEDAPVSTRNLMGAPLTIAVSATRPRGSARKGEIGHARLS